MLPVNQESENTTHGRFNVNNNYNIKLLYSAYISTNKAFKALNIYIFSEKKVIAVMNSETQL